MTENNNNVLNEEIKEQIKTDEGFKTIVVMKLISIETSVKDHEKRLGIVEVWKERMHGVWWAIVGLGVIVAILGAKSCSW